jgi:hypothetical protein
MTTIHADVDAWQELDSRTNDGLVISLLWQPTRASLRVTVSDSRNDDSFQLDVTAADARSAFEHPFAYLAQREARSADTSIGVPVQLIQI